MQFHGRHIDLARLEEATLLLNDLLRGELAAVETYQQALERMPLEALAATIRSLQADHLEATNALRRFVVDLGGEPATESGVWGAWAQMVEGTAVMFGTTTGLLALRSGEKHGLAKYEAAARDERLPLACRELLRDVFLAWQRGHVETLERLIAAV